jgi:hypothetical protein
MKLFRLVYLGSFLFGNGGAFNMASSSVPAVPSELKKICLPPNRGLAMAVGAVSGFLIRSTPALAETEIEYSELPPPYIPVLFGLVLLAVGEECALLTYLLFERCSLWIEL